MIIEKDIAKEISELMLEYGAKLDKSLITVQEKCTKAEFDIYRDAVAKILADMLLNIMNPLYKMHPDLKPKELD